MFGYVQMPEVVHGAGREGEAEKSDADKARRLAHKIAPVGFLGF